MDANAIERYLSLVGEELKAMNVQMPIQLLLIGGGYIITQVQNRTVTDDVDLVWIHPEVYADSEVYRLFEAAVRFVADDEGLDSAWLSTDVSDFVRVAGPLPKMSLWRNFGMVQVYLPPKDFILAHKLIAGRGKDESDIRTLCAQLHVTTRKKAQKVLDKYISHAVQENSDVEEVLKLFFPI